MLMENPNDNEVVENEVLEGVLEEANEIPADKKSLEFAGSEGIEVEKYVQDSYLDYAMYVLKDRALPSVCDGLKPVHRRILYAMSELGLSPGSKYKKSARTIGDVLGKYHPHGDSACYETMVGMAQNFTIRYPLVDGQGNWGSPDDPKSFAAMRYTESRLHKYSDVLLSEVDGNIVDWTDNFDGTMKEPSVLPSKLPNILINGTSGIAVGLATDIPPHNLREVSWACVRMIDDPEINLDGIMEHIVAPDLPLGGEIVTPKEDIKHIYEKGRGTIKVRARYKIEDGNIVFYDLPYHSTSTSIIIKIAEQMRNKKMPLIEDIYDEGDQNEPIRIVIVTKKKANNNAIVQHLYATTDLERNIKLNMNLIGPDENPRNYNLLNIIKDWLDFRRTCIRRRTEATLEKTNKRIHILEGLELTYLNLDKVIDIVRNSDEPSVELQERIGLSDKQAYHVLETKLRNLAKLEEEKIINEKNELNIKKQLCESILGNQEVLDSVMRTEIIEIADQFGDERRTSINSNSSIESKEILETELLPSERITVILSEKGWVKAGKGELEGEASTYKAGDNYSDSSYGMSNNTIAFISSMGKVYNINYTDIPNARGYGEPISSKINLAKGEKIEQVLIVEPNSKYFVATNEGYGFIAPSSAFATKMKGGKKFVTKNNESQILTIEKIEEKSNKVFALSNTKGLVFELEQMKELDKGKGVKIINLKDGDTLKHISTIGDNSTIKINDEELPVDGLINQRARVGKSHSIEDVDKAVITIENLDTIEDNVDTQEKDKGDSDE
jgi:topoisomerase-4 subunit A